MHHHSLHERWETLCARIGAFDQVELTFELIEALYATPPRVYHTLDHVAQCLRVFDTVRRLADTPDCVEFALWLHDSVYEADKEHNEQRSAETAGMVGGLLGCDPDFVTEARDNVLVTRHSNRPAPGDQALTADIDLSILGAPEEEYDAYADAIRREFDFITDAHFRAARAAFLQRMLDRANIYATPYFRTEFEARARANMERELARLE